MARHQPIMEDGIKINFRKDLIENLKLMNHKQLGTFIDKVLIITNITSLKNDSKAYLRSTLRGKWGEIA